MSKTASARSNPPWGFKAVVIYGGCHPRTQVVRRKNFKARADAVAYAERWIKANEQHTAIQRWLFENRDERGRRRSEAEARAALGFCAC